jgi:prepilin-type N-terminal cleavage/methylation domain-containing protein
MKRRIKGFTLTEVMVSVAIAGILLVAISTVFIRYFRIENRLTVKENILGEIENIYEIYTSSPSSFPETYSSYLGREITFLETEIIYYDDDFKIILEEESGNYLILKYKILPQGESQLYSLEIEPYHKNKMITFNEQFGFNREIIDGGGNEE